MPTIKFFGKSFTYGISHTKKTYNITVVNLYKGGILYNRKTDEFASLEVNRPYKEYKALYPEGAIVLTSPELNGCHCLIAKSKTYPHKVWMAHISPLALRASPRLMMQNVYTELFEYAEIGEEIDFICFNEHDQQIFILACLNKNIKINSFRNIAIKKHYLVENFVINRHPSSIYIHYFVEDDGLVVYADNYLPNTYISGLDSAAIHVAKDVFEDVAQPILFQSIKTVYPKQPMEKFKGYREFIELLPLFRKKFMTDYPDLKQFWYEFMRGGTLKAVRKKIGPSLSVPMDYFSEDLSRFYKVPFL